MAHAGRFLLSNNNGNVFRIQNNRVPGRSQSFTYDQLNRLTSALTDATSGADCWSFNYAYDAWANLNIASSPQCDSNVPAQFKFNVASAANNQFPGYCYDAAGNLINPGLACVSAYAYDAENRLVSIAGGAYSYDGDGKRVKKDGAATTPTLYWTGTGSDPLAESDLAGNINEEYVFFNGKRIARVDVAAPSAPVHYYFSGHLGSADVITNTDGTQIEEESVYYPFGGELPVTLGPNHFKFTGKERDPETGLDYFLARHYTSDKGRFLQPDEFTGGPVEAFSSNDPAPPSPTFYADKANPQSLNKYAYTYNNPLRYTDPDGHDIAISSSQWRDVLVNAYQTPTGREMINSMAASSVTFDFKSDHLGTLPNGDQIYGTPDPSGLKVSEDGKATGTVNMLLDFDKMKTNPPQTGADAQHVGDHELVHGDQFAKDAKGTLEKMKAGETKGLEDKAEEKSKQMEKEKPDMAKTDAAKAIDTLDKNKQ